MSDIKPVLTAEQWQPIANRVMFADHLPGGVRIDVFGDGNGGDVVIWETENPDRAKPAGPVAIGEHDTKFAAIAAFNAALPDFDKRKIVRADADVCALIAENSGAWTDENRERLARVAAILGALLRPAEQTRARFDPLDHTFEHGRP